MYLGNDVIMEWIKTSLSKVLMVLPFLLMIL
jgi:hypothetical protein